MEEIIKNIQIADYDYHLPEEKIARYPAEPRDSSKLLVYAKGQISEDTYSNLHQRLPDKSLLIFNQTRVVQARLKFPKNENTNIEVFCLEPLQSDIQQAMQSSSPVEYRCLVGAARKWKSGPLKLKTERGYELTAEKLDREESSFIIRFSWDSDLHFAEILEEAGKTPLPPYLNREAEETDKNHYQTLFARTDGSVAAPTAGLHFTDTLLQKLRDSSVEEEFLTLHVGAGTFRPVSSPTMGGHTMHSEEFFVEKQFLQKLIDSTDKHIIPVGTTSMRALESLYWIGAKALRNGELKEYVVNQWEAYQGYVPPQPKKAFRALLHDLEAKQRDFVTARTSLIIAPGYAHRLCSGMLTNFHQPRSTLLLLVASFIGEDWKSVYKYALENNFRFLSYGDGCLLLKD